MHLHQKRALVLILLIIIFAACDTSPEIARKSLEVKNISYSAYTFVQKAEAGDIETVKKFLIAGMDPNSVDKEGNNALISAVKEGRLEVARLLLDSGADIEARDKKFGGTPLIWAALKGRTDLDRKSVV